MWRLVTWTVTGHYMNHSWLMVHWSFLNKLRFTLLKPSLLWSATFIKTSLSRNVFHTAGPLCGDPKSNWWDLFTEISSVGVSHGVSLNKLYDVMEVISVLLTPCAGNPQTPVDSPHKWSAVGISFDASVNKLLNKQLKWHQSQILFYAHVTSL